MTLLLDTHTFLWFCQGDPALSPTAKALLEDPKNRKLVGVASGPLRSAFAFFVFIFRTPYALRKQRF